MQIFFKSRNAARNSLKSHKLVDNGPDSKPGKRYARQLNKPVQQKISVQSLQSLYNMLEAA